MSVCRIKTTASSFVFLRPRSLYRRSKDNRLSTDIIEKGVKSSMGPNCNRDIFYCHAQSAGFSFSSLDSVFRSRAIPFTTRIASRKICYPRTNEGRYLNIRSLIHPARTQIRTCIRTHVHHLRRVPRRSWSSAVRHARGFVWYITEDVDCPRYDPAALHCRRRDNGCYVLLSSSPYSMSHSFLMVSFPRNKIQPRSFS